MRTEEKEYILDRMHTPQHDRLKIQHSRTKKQKDYYREIELIFDHQRAVYVEPSSDDSKEDIIARHFYKKCYSPSSLLMESGPAKISIAEFLVETALADAAIDRNNIKYLLGEVGIGKSTFINYLVSNELREAVEQNKIWFVRLDMHEAMLGRCSDFSDVIIALATKIFRVIRNNIHFIDHVDTDSPDFIAWIKFKELVTSGTNYSGDLLIVMSELVHAIRDVSGRRCFLIFDNLDYLCHQNDRGLFAKNDDSGLKPFLITIHDLISQFTHSGTLCSLESNILIVSRYDSYEVIQTGDHTDRMPKREDVGYFTLDSPDSKVVYLSRKKLLDFTVNNLFASQPGKIKDYKEIISLIEVHMNYGSKKDRRLSDSIKKLARCGHRDTMGFFAQYAWIGDKHIGSRLIEQYPVGLLTYMLNNCRRFSQTYSCFPNIYLVNIEQGEDAGNGDPCSSEHMHPHTYWLKWFIATLIGKQRRYSTADYVTIFKGNQQDGYGEKEIRKCLSSLAEVNLTNMVKVEFKRNPRDQEKLIISKIELTERGKYCFDNLFNRFYYLQLIVDDHLLPVPRCIYEEFNYKTHNLDYGYVTLRNHEEYSAYALKMIKLKAWQVFLFLILLEESLEIEREIHSSIFKRLEIDFVFPPVIEELRQNVRTDLTMLNRSNRIDIKVLEKNALEKRPEIRSQLMEMYFLSA